MIDDTSKENDANKTVEIRVVNERNRTGFQKLKDLLFNVWNSDEVTPVKRHVEEEFLARKEMLRSQKLQNDLLEAKIAKTYAEADAVRFRTMLDLSTMGPEQVDLLLSKMDQHGFKLRPSEDGTSVYVEHSEQAEPVEMSGKGQLQKDNEPI